MEFEEKPQPESQNDQSSLNDVPVTVNDEIKSENERGVNPDSQQISGDGEDAIAGVSDKRKSVERQPINKEQILSDIINDNKEDYKVSSTRGPLKLKIPTTDEIVDNTSQQSSIPDNILSPPKSETPTDETQTATSSPASQSHTSPPTNSMQSPLSSGMSPLESVSIDTVSIQAINVIANGSIPKSGKPLMSAINKKLNKPRGRPKRPKALVAMYQSEISNMGIKLCIKKSETTPTKSKPSRKRKSKHRELSDSEDSEYETKRRREKANNNTDKNKKDLNYKEPEQQSVWGSELPESVLYKIFQYVVHSQGCLPTLIRLGRVCSLWRLASLSPLLWKSMDLSTGIKEKYRTEIKLKWFLDYRCSCCTELNVSNWKVSDVTCVLTKIVSKCPNLLGITLSGWKGFTSEHLQYLGENLTKLERLDLSSINVEMNPSKSAVGLQSLCNALQSMNGRLTHLHLANNRLAGIPQIVSSLSSHCCNLVLLDLSNVRTIAVSHGYLNVEKLQQGCQKLRVLRITNSHITLSPTSLQEQMDSPGFPDLEELSLASLATESRVINDDFLQRILKTSSKLKLLDVRGCARLTHESLIRLPAWDLKHLFLCGCSITRDIGSGLELIASKWAHSLIELDLAWANVQLPLDNALKALAEKGVESPLSHLNLCGSSVSEDAVKDVLACCPNIHSINLSSCRGLPRGVKRLMHGPTEIKELREVLKVATKFKVLDEQSTK